MTRISCAALLFDMDGVLIDSTPAVARVWTRFALRHGFDAAEVVHRAHGRPSITTVREYLPNGDHLAENKEIERDEIADLDGIVPLPGARELLSCAAARALDDRDIVLAASGGSAIENEWIAAAGSFCHVERHHEWQAGAGSVSEGRGGAWFCGAGLRGGGGCAGGRAFREGCGRESDRVVHDDAIAARIAGCGRGLGGAGLLGDFARCPEIQDGKLSLVLAED